VDDN